MTCDNCNGYGKIITRYMYPIGRCPSFEWVRCIKCTNNYWDVLDKEKRNPTRRIKCGIK